MAGHRAKYISPPSPLGGDKPTPAQPPKEILRASTCQELCVWVVKSDCGVACILFPRQEVWGSERDRDLPGNSQQLSWEVDPEFWRLRSLCIEKEVNPIRDLPRATRRSSVQFSSVQSLSHVQLFATPWTAARQASLSITNSQSLLKLMSIESVMPSNHLIPFSSRLQSFPASGSFQMSQFFVSGGQSIGVWYLRPSMNGHWPCLQSDLHPQYKEEGW